MRKPRYWRSVVESKEYLLDSFWDHSSRQRRLAKCERRLHRIGDKIQGIIRIAHAQIVTVRKILKSIQKIVTFGPVLTTG